uniref:Pink-eyed dilution-like protein n=1 Tax=Salpingoeca infusionum TaxID=86018 RepID=A0A1D8RAH9_9EUKA|nr:pink-eyed dilution-like protein [Salpingoeca infusionum]|eukprot:m.126149 g.126149  ORF g.126149 m.126149 type:complete len:729 (+) comp13818_c4_seq3:120-2306(+)
MSLELEGDHLDASITVDMTETELDASRRQDDPGSLLLSANEAVKYQESGSMSVDEETTLLNPKKQASHDEGSGGCCKKKLTWKRVWQMSQKVLLVLLLLLATIAFALVPEDEGEMHLFSMIQGTPAAIELHGGDTHNLELHVELPVNFSDATANITIQLLDVNGTILTEQSWIFGDVGDVLTTVFGDLASVPRALAVSTTSALSVPFMLSYSYVTNLYSYDVALAAVILAIVYILIIFELIHRSLAAILGSFLAIGVLSLMHKQPSLETIVGWIDYETVMLLFGMMVIVGVLSDTGVFEWSAVQAYRLSKGNTWTLVTILCTISAVVSAFLDNVTTILLLTPVTIRICHVIGLDPIPVLLAEVVFSNIGGTATAVGDPPNVIIVSSDWSMPNSKDIQFAEFTGHMALGIVFVSIGSYFVLKLLYRNEPLANPDPPHISDLKWEVRLWQKTRDKMLAHGEDATEALEALNTKIEAIEAEIDGATSTPDALWQETWEERIQAMSLSAQIKNRGLLRDSSVVLFFVILLFFIHSIPAIHLDLGWIAILGAICLLLMTGSHSLDTLLERIEWGTLLFFAALFVLMEALAELGLIEWIGDKTASVIRSVDDDSRLAAAMLLVLWVSALASSFIDNIPFTTAMIPVIKNIAADESLNLPLRPLVWALAFGACLGGNGTLIGASANVVCAGMAEQAGLSLSFNRFFKVGFPIMLVSVVIATIYLVICHIAIGWNV